MKISHILSNYLAIITQILLLIVIWLAAGLLQQYLLPFVPQGLLGMLFLFLLLFSRKFPLRFIEKGGRFLINHMLLFFIPAIIKVIEYKQLLLDYGIGIIITIILGTLSVMLAVGFVVDKVYAYEVMKKRQKKEEF